MLVGGRGTAAFEASMKDRTLIYMGLVLSVASFCYAGWLHHQTETMVKRAAKEREAEIVRYLAPHMRAAYSGFGFREDSIPKSPTTFEELFQPIEQMSQIINPRRRP